MNVSVVIDWKFVGALGVAAAVVIVALKMDAEAAERVSTHVVDALQGVTIDGNSINL